MKPLLMMRTRGLSGPLLAKHQGSIKLSKSVGNYISTNLQHRVVYEGPIATSSVDSSGYLLYQKTEPESSAMLLHDPTQDTIYILQNTGTGLYTFGVKFNGVMWLLNRNDDVDSVPSIGYYFFVPEDSDNIQTPWFPIADSAGFQIVDDLSGLTVGNELISTAYWTKWDAAANAVTFSLPVLLNGVTHNGEVVTHNGEVVTYG